MQNKVEKLQEKVFEKTQELDSLKATSKLLTSELQVFEMNKQVLLNKLLQSEQKNNRDIKPNTSPGPGRSLLQPTTIVVKWTKTGCLHSERY